MPNDHTPGPLTRGSRDAPENPGSLSQFVSGLVALRAAFNEAHGTKVTALQQWCAVVGARFAEWQEQNRPMLDQLGQILERLPEWTENLQAHRLLLERGLELLRQGGYGSAKYILLAEDVLPLGAADQEEVERRLYAQTIDPQFGAAILTLYGSLGFRAERAALLAEAIDLHREGRFGGSVTLPYSQLEGVISDALAELRKRKQVVAIAEWRLKGLHDKVRAADAALAVDTHVFEELMQAVLVSSDRGCTISRSRNLVLHGRDPGFAIQQRSTQLSLWLFALLIELRSVFPAQDTRVSDAL